MQDRLILLAAFVVITWKKGSFLVLQLFLSVALIYGLLYAVAIFLIIIIFGYCCLFNWFKLFLSHKRILLKFLTDC